jgi:hypothetical protein
VEFLANPAEFVKAADKTSQYVLFLLRQIFYNKKTVTGSFFWV